MRHNTTKQNILIGAGAFMLGSTIATVGITFNRMSDAQEALERCAVDNQRSGCTPWRVAEAARDADWKSTDTMIVGGKTAMAGGLLLWADEIGAAAALRRRRQQPEPKKPVAKTPRAKNKLPRS